MKPSYYDAAGRIDYPAIKVYAGELREGAIDAFWGELSQRAAAIFHPKQRQVTGQARWGASSPPAHT